MSGVRPQVVGDVLTLTPPLPSRTTHVDLLELSGPTGILDEQRLLKYQWRTQEF